MVRALAALSRVLAIAVCSWGSSAASQPAGWQPITNCPGMAGYVVECVKPSATDPVIRRFDDTQYAMVGSQAKPNGQLLLFLPGTGGVPMPSLAFLKAAADAGYRVISLMYNDDISVAVYCPNKPDPECSQAFRRMRIYGTGPMGDAAVDNTPAESIVNRLGKLLQYLDRSRPGGGWGNYLKDGVPDWRRIAVSGQSQGAGMAAYIAKQHEVARVILFSSPWDYVQRGGQTDLAPWIAAPSLTPPDRWFGGYHARENTAALLARSYAGLKIPQAHIRVFDGELPAAGKGNNPFHNQGLNNPIYATERAFFLSQPTAVKAASQSTPAGGTLAYKQFTVDIAEIAVLPDRQEILSALQRQIDICADAGLSPENLAFVRSVPIALKVRAKGDRGSPGSYNARGVTLRALVYGAQMPILLHELMHAYHHRRLPGGVRNPDVLKFYERARTIPGLFPAGSYMLSNAAEYFAMTASVYLHGSAARDPFTRAALKAKQPNYYAWLQKEFGPRPGE